MFFYKSFEDLKSVIAEHYAFFHEFDVIISVPRSGIIPGTLLSLYLNKPLSTPDLISQGKFLSGGHRIRHEETLLKGTDSLKMLVVDDSCESGEQLKKVQAQLSKIELKHSIKYLAIYTHVNSERLVDFSLENVPLPRIFEWNILNHLMLKYSCVDIDGVLCPDPSEKENDDSNLYLNFILNAPCLVKPKYQIHSLVTSRLEKYRNPTLEWLHKNKIDFQTLIMSSHKSAAERRAAHDHAKQKAEYYIRSGNRLFIESSHNQAQEIFRISRLPVFCVDSRTYFDPLDGNQIQEFKKIRTSEMRISYWQKIKNAIKPIINR